MHNEHCGWHPDPSYLVKPSTRHDRIDPLGRTSHAGSPNAPRARSRPAAARRSRVATLVDWLADDSPSVVACVRTELLRVGDPARSLLRRAAESDDAALRARARQLLLELERRRAFRRLAKVALAERPDLERALFSIDRFGAPGVDVRPAMRALDAFGDELRRRVSRPGAQYAEELVGYLCGERGYRGSEEDYHHPDHVLLHRVISRRRGLPLTLCALHALVARRAGVAAELLPLPGHVLLTVEQDGRRTLVDAFGGGRTLSEADCVTYLTAHRKPFRTEWLEPAGAKHLFGRQLANLAESCRQRHRFAEARALGAVLRELARRP